MYKKQRKCYISNDTWKFIEERTACREKGDPEKEQHLNKQIRRKADAGRLSFTIHKLEQGINLKEKWLGIKDCKGKLVPTFTK